jgi:lysophospholipase L1-like esterase
MTNRLFADSFGDNSGASSPAYGYGSLLAAKLGSLLNYSHGGDMWADQADEVLAAAVAAGDVSIIELGCNDQKWYLTDAAKRAYFRKGVQHHAAWLGLGNKIKARSNIANETGTWEDTTLYGVGRCARTAGATSSFTVSGTSVYLSYLISNGPYGPQGAFTVKIDGVVVGSYTTRADPAPLTYNGAATGPQLLRFSGLTPGQHVVQVVVTQADRVYIQWAAGNEQSAKPKVFVCNVTRSGTYQWGGSDANVAAYNADIAAMVGELQSDGLDVALVDICSLISPQSDLAGDSLHPNDAGHRKISDALFTAIIPSAYTYTDATVKIRSDGKVFANGIELITGV